MWNAHARGGADQVPADAMVQTEHSYAVTEEGRRNREPMREGVLQPHGGIRGGVYRGGGDFQIRGKDVGPVRRQLAGGPQGTPSMELDGENSKEGGDGTTSVCHVLLGGGSGSITFWGGDLGLVGGDVPEDEGSASGLTKADNGS